MADLEINGKSIQIFALDENVANGQTSRTETRKRWLRHLGAKVKNASGTLASAHLVAFTISRENLTHLDDEGYELDEAFRAHPGLDEIFKDNIYWDEITVEDFIVITEIRVDAADRRQGYGRALVEALCAEVKSRTRLLQITAFVPPGSFNSEVDKEIARRGISPDQDTRGAIHDRQSAESKIFLTQLGFTEFYASSRYWYKEF